MVPQFIDVEDKILGPITVRQFILIVIGGVIIFLSFRFGDILFFLFMAAVVSATVFLFGFLKINGALFHIFLINVITALSKPKLRVWQKNLSDGEIKALLRQPETKAAEPVPVRKSMVPASRLAELALIVDTRGEYKGE